MKVDLVIYKIVKCLVFLFDGQKWILDYGQFSKIYFTSLVACIYVDSWQFILDNAKITWL